MLPSKFYLAGVTLIALGSWAWYTQSLIADNAVSEAALVSTTTALRDYSLSVETEIEAYTIATAELRKGYTKAEERANDLESKLIKHDFQELFDTKPKIVQRHINNGSRKLFEHITRITSADTKDVETTSAREAETD